MKRTVRDRLDAFGVLADAALDPISLQAAVFMANLPEEPSHDQHLAFQALIRATQRMQRAGCFDSEVGELFAQVADTVQLLISRAPVDDPQVNRLVGGLTYRLLGVLFMSLADKVGAPQLSPRGGDRQ